MTSDDEPDHISATRARGGTTPGVARYALIFGTALTIIAFVIIYLVFI